MEGKRILILYAPLGAGHGIAAKAIAEAFAQNYSEFEVKTANVLDFSFEIFRAGLPGIFNYVTLKIPFLYKWTYDYLNHESGYNFINQSFANAFSIFNQTQKNYRYFICQRLHGFWFSLFLVQL